MTILERLIEIDNRLIELKSYRWSLKDDVTVEILEELKEILKDLNQQCIKN